MPVLDRASLEQSPLADLHAIASELSLDGFRRLRRDELIDAILERQGEAEGGAPVVDAPEADREPLPAEEEEEEEAGREPAPGRRRRGRRGGRGRGAGRASAAADAEPGEEEEDVDRAPPHDEGSEERQPGVDRPGREPARADEEIVEGVVELLPGGSAFVRVDPPDPSDDDVYVSAAQVKRCELVSGDRVSGPRRAPRRSERFASMLRIDTIDGRPAAEVADRARFEDLPAAFPSQRLPLGSGELTLTAIAELAPLGRGSRATVVGAAQSGKTEVLRRLADVLSGRDDLQLWLVLAGVRPEEISEWRAGPVAPTVALGLEASPDAQGQAVEGAVDQARRIAARGGDVVVLIDSLGAVAPSVARRVLASARQLVDGGSLTVIAAAPAPVGGETAVIALDATLARAGQFPAIEPAGTWTMRRELLAQ